MQPQVQLVFLISLAGGELCQLNEQQCTHVVVDKVQTLPADLGSSVTVVKAEWFWASVLMEVCADERLYAVSQVSVSLPVDQVKAIVCTLR